MSNHPEIPNDLTVTLPASLCDVEAVQKFAAKHKLPVHAVVGYAVDVWFANLVPWEENAKVEALRNWSETTLYRVNVPTDLADEIDRRSIDERKSRDQVVAEALRRRFKGGSK